MKITELEARLKEIREMHGDIEIYLFREENPVQMNEYDVICIGGGNSHKYDDGVYILGVKK